jgi:hypothetical protein
MKLRLILVVTITMIVLHLIGCNTVQQTTIVQGGGGPCGPNCAPSRSQIIREREVVVVREERRPSFWSSFIEVNVVPGGGCPPRGRMIRQQCPPPWHQQQCPPPGWNNGQQHWNGSPQQNGLTWGDPNRGPGGYL